MRSIIDNYLTPLSTAARFMLLYSMLKKKKEKLMKMVMKEKEKRFNLYKEKDNYMCKG